MFDTNHLWEQGTRFGRPLILTAMVILRFPVFTLIVHLKRFSHIKALTDMWPGVKNQTAAYIPGHRPFCPQDRNIRSTRKSTPELPQVSAQVNQFQFWFILLCQAEN